MADVFDALSTRRVYRPAFTFDAFLAAKLEIKALMPYTAGLPAASR